MRSKEEKRDMNEKTGGEEDRIRGRQRGGREMKRRERGMKREAKRRQRDDEEGRIEKRK